jgi:hypothetical protein
LIAENGFDDSCAPITFGERCEIRAQRVSRRQWARRTGAGLRTLNGD